MHISLLEDSRKRSGQIMHCLRGVVANLPVINVDRDVTYDAETISSNTYIPIMEDPARNKNRVVAATPRENSLLESSDLDSSANGDGKNEHISLQDCYELTVAMECNANYLTTVYGTLAVTGLGIAESHGFTTHDGYYIYWFTLQDYGRPTSSQLTALDNLLHARFSLSSQEPKPANGHHSLARGTKGGGNGHLAKSSQQQQQEDEGAGKDAAGDAKFGSSGGGMKRGSSFLNLWKGDLGVVHEPIADWEIDPDQLKLEKKVGQGAFGAIYKGRFQGEVVAIKQVKSDFNKEFEHIKEFAQEISIISNLVHENIVIFKGACTKSSNVCIVYEFMEKGNLKEFLTKCKQRSKPNMETTLKLALDIAKGMVYLSEKSIIHRDLKAANILMSDSGAVKIGDFGVARLLPRNEECMTAETGTYRWMAPEVIEHKPYGSQADVYSFGVVLWELVTGGKTPYELLSPIQAAVGVAKHGLRPKIPQSCPSGVAKMMKDCWETNPEDRPTFEKLVVTLEELLDSQSAAAAEVSSGNGKQRSFTSMLSKLLVQ